MTKSLRVTSLSDFYVTPNPHELLQAFPAVFFQERKKLGKTVTHQKNHFIDIIFIVDMLIHTTKDLNLIYGLNTHTKVGLDESLIHNQAAGSP